jgi:hypothetical protein
MISRIGSNRDHAGDARLSGAGDDGIHLFDQAGISQMAMSVNEHSGILTKSLPVCTPPVHHLLPQSIESDGSTTYQKLSMALIKP